MEFCVDERGRIVQKVHFARRKAAAHNAPSSSTAVNDECVDNNIHEEDEEDGISCSIVPSAGVGGSATAGNSIAKGGVPVPFPWRLHDMLDAMEQQGKNDVVTWQPHGLAFLVKDPKAFVEQVMPHYFSQSKYASFQRQLNLYGFSRLGHGRDKGAYYHGCFIKGKRELVRNMIRKKVKGTMVRKSFGPEQEPNFYDPQWTLLQQASTAFTPLESESTGPYMNPSGIATSVISSTVTRHRPTSPVASESGSTTSATSSSSVSLNSVHHQQQRHHQHNSTHSSWDDTKSPVPRLHGFTTHIDPRLTLVIPVPVKKQPPQEHSQLSKLLLLKVAVQENACPLSRLAAVAGQFDDTTS